MEDIHEAYTFVSSEPHTAIQMCLYGGRQITTLTEAG